jgi:spore maturation protein CgeB
MKFVFFHHSLISDWNHGNAHFLRGVASELLSRGHDVDVYEPADGWSLHHLLAEQGPQAVEGFHRAYPELRSRFYLPSIDIERALDRADVVLVHEWNPPELVARIGAAAAAAGATAFFHDTHHRAVSDERTMAGLQLDDYAGVLAFGAVIRELYVTRGWAANAWVWHEAADIRRFRPLRGHETTGDLVWIGNWGDDERERELHEFLVAPVKALGLGARVHGVRYPDTARAALEAAGIAYAGWVANYSVPEVFAQFRSTVHIPRGVYARDLPGIPTIRMFEALACGIPLVSAPWEDAEKLFGTGTDYLVARTGAEMTRHLRTVLNEADVARELAANGLRTIRARHTCAHRVDELLRIVRSVRGTDSPRRHATPLRMQTQ